MPRYTEVLSSGKDVVLAGDLNCDLLSENPCSEALLSFASPVGATQLIKDPTRVTSNSSTLIDVLFISNHNLVKSSGVCETTISDHFLIYAVLNLKVTKPVVQDIVTRSFKKFNATDFVRDISMIPWDVINLQDSVDDRLAAFNALFLTCLDEHAPEKVIKLKHNPNPFINGELKSLIRNKTQLHKKARATGTLEDWKAFKSLKRRIKSAIRQAEIHYFNEEILSNKNCRGAIWKTIRRAIPKSTSQQLIYTKDTVSLSNDFNAFFTSVGEQAAMASRKLAGEHGLLVSESVLPVPYPEEALFYFRPVTSEEVRNVILSMPNNKAPGFDKVPVKVIKNCLSEILDTVTALINLSFESNIFPREWKKAVVTPHLKEGDHEEANNNRPISLLPVLSKVAERLALTQFTEYLVGKQRLTNHQSGNRKLHSTETISLLVTDHIFGAMDKKKITAMVLIDLSKAFDSICHERLLQKLQSVGASSPSVKWFQSYLSDRYQVTRIGQSTSTPLLVKHGVPQGSILGPLLFTIYMNDLPKVVSNCNVESYVDDTKSFISFSLSEVDLGLSSLSQDLRNIAEWCCSNKLLINPSKTKFMIFGMKKTIKNLPNLSIPFLGKTLTPVTVCKDLGLTFDATLSFDDYITSLTSTLTSALCQINRVRHLFDKNALLVMINCLVFSKLYYCSTVWSGTTQKNIKKLQQVQNFAARIVTGTRKYEHITPALDKLGWLSVNDSLLYRDAIMMYKIVHGLAPLYLSSKLVVRSQIHNHFTRQANDLNILRCRTSKAKRSFFNHAALLWNSFSLLTRNLLTLGGFKKAVRAELTNKN